MNHNRIITMAAVFCALATLSAHAQAPVISSFGRNGELVCTNLTPDNLADVEWASSATGPWTNNWAGLVGVRVPSNGMIRVSVPMFYRVRTANPGPSGMAFIPAGSFTMGDRFNEGYSGEVPVHTVYVSAFYMDKCDVTYAMWQEVYDWAIAHGYAFDSAGKGKAADHPVQTVNWYDCVKWCNARSEKEGKTPAYYTSAAQAKVYRSGQLAVENAWVKWSSGYRLPTEAEWEKAARGGASGQRFPWGNTITHSEANYSGNPSYYVYDMGYSGNDTNYNKGGAPYTSPVDEFAPNGYGLYDMAGNVWQWCWDWYGSYGSASQTDPRGPTSGSNRVHRGGSWYDDAFYCRTASRGSFSPVNRIDYIGFRAVVPPGQP